MPLSENRGWHRLIDLFVRVLAWLARKVSNHQISGGTPSAESDCSMEGKA